MVKETPYTGLKKVSIIKVSIPSRGSGKGDTLVLYYGQAAVVFVSIPSRGSGKGDPFNTQFHVEPGKLTVSIPSRGSGKGDTTDFITGILLMFQSPLGEVVKETNFWSSRFRFKQGVSIPSRGSGKGDT